jgi:mannose-6-phosphate isomerase
MLMRTPLFFEPIYKERVWGGVGLESALGRKLPADKRIGESWEVVDRPEAVSRIARGPAQGRTLRELLEQYPAEIMGPDYSPGRPFPILVKWLDCQDRLSLEVHPPAEVAERLGGEPKTENWYIAGAAPNAHLIVGLKRGATREIFERAIKTQTVEECVHRFPVRAGQSIFVRSGQIHAIDAGNLILEIQQNSDTTYRVYDWGRVGLDGKPRTLHIEESLASIDFEDIEPLPLAASGEDALLAQCEEFTIRKYQMSAGRKLSLDAGRQPRLLHVVSGRLRVEGEGGEVWEAGLGDNLLLPFAGRFGITVVEEGVALVTSDFV